jgi:hypothetical protein
MNAQQPAAQAWLKEDGGRRLLFAGKVNARTKVSRHTPQGRR